MWRGDGGRFRRVDVLVMEVRVVAVVVTWQLSRVQKNHPLLRLHAEGWLCVVISQLASKKDCQSRK
jgi:hypothetical protein